MIEALTYPFMQRALAAGIIISLVCGLLSFFVVLRRLSFIGVGLSHAAFGGVALGFFLGIEPSWTAMGFCAATGLLIAFIRQRSRIEEDTAIGIFFAANMAFGVMLIGLSRSYNMDLFGYLFGNILAVTRSDLALMTVTAVVVLLIVSLLFKEMLFCSLDEESASVSGIPSGRLDYLFMVLLSMVIVVSVKVVGIVLVSAMLVIPGATGLRLASGSGYRKVVLLSVGTGLAAALGGLWISYLLDLPSGATVVLLATLVFFASLLARR